MTIPIKPHADSLDTIFLHKLNASNKISTLLNNVESTSNSEKMTRTASSVDQQQLINAFITILSSLNLKVDDSRNIQDVISDLSKSGTNSSENKIASRKTSERKDEIKIVSKSQKDSHYQFDISKDLVSKDGKSVFMVSCYARDAYLGRYLIKRNFFYTAAREEAANQAYDEIMTKTAAIKERYYNEVIDVSTIFTQVKKVLDGVISEIKLEEDSVGTNINRQTT